MSFLRKSDVKNHLSTRSETSHYSPGRIQRDPAPVTDSENKASESKAAEVNTSVSPGNPTSPEVAPNAEVGGSSGLPD